ncbi:metal-dependent transcriptional regulator [Sinomonas puerhi]|uniref:metal-dependent transcriptional regulator n=1 Tax=Sinomonas puerhi TaxID=3238584 RepID=UPI003C12B8A2
MKSPLSSSTEDYLKTIYAFTEWQDAPITPSQLAARLGVANSSVSEMVRKLKDQGLVDHRPYGAVHLTAEGRSVALTMVRRHRLLETFLVTELGYSWDEVHVEAERIEHAVSDLFVERLAAKLGDPQRDPHGDPIPTADGVVPLVDARLLSELDPGHEGTITRISDENPDMLRYLAAEQIALDTQLTVVRRKPFGGPLVVRISQGDTARDFDVPDEVADAVWIHNDHPHPGCTAVRA